MKTILSNCFGAVLFVLLLISSVQAVPEVTGFTRIQPQVTNSSTLSWYVDFTERVDSWDDNYATPQPFGGGGTLTYDFVPDVVQITDTRLQISITNVTGVGSIGLTIRPQFAIDEFFNWNTQFGYAPGYDVNTEPFDQLPNFNPGTDTTVGASTLVFDLQFDRQLNETATLSNLNSNNLLSGVNYTFTGNVITVTPEIIGGNTVRVTVSGIAAGAPSQQGTLRLSIPAFNIVDAFGNTFSSTIITPTYNIDQSPTRFSFGTYEKINQLTYELPIDFTRNVSDLVPSEITVTPDDSGFVVQNIGVRYGVDNSIYIISVTFADPPPVGTSNMLIRVADSAIIDELGTPQTAIASYQPIDFEPPSVSVDPPNDTLQSTDFVAWDVNFSEPVTGIELSDFTFFRADQGISNSTTQTPPNSLQLFVNSPSSYTVLGRVPDETESWFVLAAGAGQDNGLFDTPEVTSSKITYDFSSQFEIEVTDIILLDPNPSTGGGIGEFRFEPVFSGTAMSITDSLISVIGSAGSSSTVRVETNPFDISRWIIIVEGSDLGPGQDGTVGIRIEPGAVMDQFGGNTNQDSFESALYIVDQSTPSVVNNPAPTRVFGTLDYQWDLELSETVQFPESSEVDILRSGNSAFRNIRFSNPSQNILRVTAEVEILDGLAQNIWFSLDANSITDFVGNTYDQPIVSPPLLIEQTIPSLISGPTMITDPERRTNADPLIWNIVFSESVIVDPMGLTASAINGVPSFLRASESNPNGSVSLVDLGGGSYQIQVSGIEVADGFAEAIVAVSINDSAIRDQFGNPYPLGTSINTPALQSYVLDTSAPTTQILAIDSTGTGSSEGIVIGGNEMHWRIVFNEGVTGLDASDISFTTNGVTAGTPTVSQSGTSVFNIRLPVSGEGSAYFSFNGSTVVDTAGNSAANATSPLITKREPEIQVGSSTINVLGATYVNQTGPGTYTVGPGATLNGVMTFDTDININGAQVTGNGNVSVGSNPLMDGSFTYNGSNGTFTPNSYNSYPLQPGGIQIIPRRITLRQHDVLVDGEFGPNGPQHLSFGGMVVTTSGNITFESVRLAAETTWSGILDTSRNVYLEGGFANIGSGSISFINPVVQETFPNISNLSVSSIFIEPNRTDGSGNATLGGIPVFFSNIDFLSSGMSLGEITINVGTNVNISSLVLSNSGADIGDATFSSGGVQVQMAGNTYFGNQQIIVDRAIMPSTGPLGPGTVSNVVISAIPGNEGIFGTESSTLTIDGHQFILDNTGEFTSAAFTADTGYLYNIGSFNISIRLIRMTGTGFSAGGAFQLGGLAFDFAVQDRDPGLRLAGGIQMPPNLGQGSIALDVTYNNDNVEINSLSFCTPASKIKKSVYRLPQICFSYEQGPPEIYEGSTTVEIPEVVTIGAEAQIIDGNLNRIYAELSDLNRPIGSTGSFLQVIGAGLTNLARLEQCVWVSGRGGGLRCWTEPIKVLGRLGISAGNEIEFLDTYTFFIDSHGEFYESGFDIDGLATVVTLPVGDGVINGRFSGPEKGVKFRGEMGFAPFDMYKGTMNGFVGPDGNLNANAVAYHQIPTAVPLIGGKIIGNVGINLRYAPFSFTGRISAEVPPAVCIGDFVDLKSSNEKILGDVIPGAGPTVGEAAGAVGDGVRRGTTIIVNGVERVVTQLSEGCTPSVNVNVSMTINANGSAAYNVGKKNKNGLQDWEHDIWAPVPLSNEDADKSNDELSPTIQLFTNYESSQKIYKKDIAAKGAAAVDSIFLEDAGNTVVVLRYENPAGDPYFTIRTPGGRVLLPEVDYLENPIPDPTRVATYSSNPTVRDASWIFGQTEAGIYDIEIPSADTLGNYSIEVIVANDPPQIEITNAMVNGTQLGLSWTDSDADDDAVISFYLDTDRKGGNGYRILDGISEDDTLDMASVDLAATTLASGWYYPFAFIDDGSNAPIPVYTDTPVFVPDSEAPAVVQNINVVASGPIAIVTWDPVVDPDLQYYKVSWTDEIDSQVELGNVTVQPDETTAIITNLDQNEDYIFEVVAVRLYSASVPKRVGELKAITTVSKQLDSSTKSFDRTNAVQLMTEAIGYGKSDLPESRIVALADQAVELSISNNLWNSKDKKLTSYLEKMAANADYKAYEKLPPSNEYADGPSIGSDLIITLAPAGLNNNPRFTSKPPTSVSAGYGYSWTATAEDDDPGDVVSFSLVSGPDGMNVTPEGLVTLQTFVGIAGRHEVIIAAADGRGGYTELSWFLEILPRQEADASAIEIVTKPPANAPPESQYRYTPGIRVRTYNPPVWDLVEGPAGMFFGTDADFGTLIWDVPANQTDPVRVRIRVTMDIAGKATIDTQEWIILPEADDNTIIDSLSFVEVRGNQIAAIHSGVYYPTATNHEIGFSIQQLTPTPGPVVNLGAVPYAQGDTETLIGWSPPQDGEDYEITATLRYNGFDQGLAVTTNWTAPEPVAPKPTQTLPHASDNEPVTFSVVPSPNASFEFLMEEGISLLVEMEGITSAGTITVTRFEDLDGAAEAGLIVDDLIGQRWVISAPGVNFTSAKLTFDYEEDLLNGLSEAQIVNAFRVINDSVLDVFTAPTFTINTTDNTICIENVTAFSTWYFGASTAFDSSPPMVSAPVDAEDVSSNPDQAFFWSAPVENESSVSTLTLEVADATDFSNIIATFDVLGQTSQVVTLPDGPAFARLIATNSFGASATSAPSDGIFIDTQNVVVTLDGTPIITNQAMPNYTGTFADPDPSSGVDSITYRAKGNTLPPSLFDATFNTGASSGNWSGQQLIPFPVEGVYDFQFRGIDAAFNRDFTLLSNAIIFDATPPAITNLSFDSIPNGGFANGQVIITAEFTDNLTNVIGFDPTDNFDVFVTGPAGLTFNPVSTGPNTFVFTTTPTVDGEYSIRVATASAEDEAGNLSIGTRTLTFTLDTIPPSLLCENSFGPFGGSRQSGETIFVSASFDEPVVNVSPAAFNVQGNAFISAITPSTGPSPNYVVELTTTGTGPVDISINSGIITDVAGNEFDAAGVSTTVEILPSITALPDPAPLFANIPTSDSRFGQSLDINNSVAVIGASGLDGIGAAFVLEATDPTTFTEVQTLTPGDGASGDNFGLDVGISGDWIIVGSPNDDENESSSGSVYFFERSSLGEKGQQLPPSPSAWTEAQKFTSGDFTGVVDERLGRFGTSVAIDGNVAVVGMPYASRGGAVFVFELDPCAGENGAWVPTQVLESSDLRSRDEFGGDVSIEGNIIAVGSRRDDDAGSDTGSVYVFRRMGGIWTEERKLVPGTVERLDQVGTSVSVYGNNVAFGAPGDDDAGSSAGAGYLYENTVGTNWSAIEKLVPSFAASGDAFGESIVGNESTVLLGSPLSDIEARDAGAVALFELNATKGMIFGELITFPETPNRNDRFGTALAIDQNIGVIGAPFNDAQGYNTGGILFIDTQTGTEQPLK